MSHVHVTCMSLAHTHTHIFVHKIMQASKINIKMCIHTAYPQAEELETMASEKGKISEGF